MNQRNLDMLCRLYCDAFLRRSWGKMQDTLLRQAVELGCRKMIEEGGVLVPYALTDEEAATLPAWNESNRTDPREWSEIGINVRFELARIAKGEER